MELVRVFWKLLKAIVVEVFDTPRRDRVYTHLDWYECLTVPADDRGLSEWLGRLPGIGGVTVRRETGDGDYATPGLWLVVAYTNRGDADVPFGALTGELTRLGYVRGNRFSLTSERVKA
ncbi:unnamed protein product [Gemmata massiliana]|uniref:Uncharacterized protein n=1 Tax=Gemmata massiliana TaxID=1210884 RepID=A0A6P2D285_9BACT|nr:hypothetical protein [Gemmata massiliana]VTR93510.1 unnamed protein product [Gemmata massiliana]